MAISSIKIHNLVFLTISIPSVAKWQLI